LISGFLGEAFLAEPASALWLGETTVPEQPLKTAIVKLINIRRRGANINFPYGG
jgi:hypothetical protein